MLPRTETGEIIRGRERRDFAQQWCNDNCSQPELGDTGTQDQQAKCNAKNPDSDAVQLCSSAQTQDECINIKVDGEDLCDYIHI